MNRYATSIPIFCVLTHFYALVTARKPAPPEQRPFRECVLEIPTPVRGTGSE
jgi:hypothetical protein